MKLLIVVDAFHITEAIKFELIKILFILRNLSMFYAILLYILLIIHYYNHTKVNLNNDVKVF